MVIRSLEVVGLSLSNAWNKNIYVCLCMCIITHIQGGGTKVTEGKGREKGDRNLNTQTVLEQR